MRQKEKSYILSLFDRAGGEINGLHPHNIRVKDEKFYDWVVRYGSLGLGGVYMAGFWECDDLSRFFQYVIKEKIQDHVHDIHVQMRLAPEVITSVLRDCGHWSKHISLENTITTSGTICMLGCSVNTRCTHVPTEMRGKS
jgi:hypothetical protein